MNVNILVNMMLCMTAVVVPTAVLLSKDGDKTDSIPSVCHDGSLPSTFDELCATRDPDSDGDCGDNLCNLPADMNFCGDGSNSTTTLGDAVAEVLSRVGALACGQELANNDALDSAFGELHSELCGESGAEDGSRRSLWSFSFSAFKLGGCSKGWTWNSFQEYPESYSLSKDINAALVKYDGMLFPHAMFNYYKTFLPLSNINDPIAAITECAHSALASSSTGESAGFSVVHTPSGPVGCWIFSDKKNSALLKSNDFDADATCKSGVIDHPLACTHPLRSVASQPPVYKTITYLGTINDPSKCLMGRRLGEAALLPETPLFQSRALKVEGRTWHGGVCGTANLAAYPQSFRSNNGAFLGFKGIMPLMWLDLKNSVMIPASSGSTPQKAIDWCRGSAVNGGSLNWFSIVYDAQGAKVCIPENKKIVGAGMSYTDIYSKPNFLKNAVLNSGASKLHTNTNSWSVCNNLGAEFTKNGVNRMSGVSSYNVMSYMGKQC